MARSIESANTELLLVERHQEEKSVYAQGEWDRRSDVYVYNYDTDETIYSLINIDQKTIDHTEVLTKVQLPLTANETANALQIALDHEEIGPALIASYQEWHPNDLFDPEELQVSPFMFKGEQYGIYEGKSAECGLNRCAHLMLAVAFDGQVLPVQPVVNLSTGEAFIPQLGQ